MGEAKKKRERFLEDHPTCIFCGGVTAATTIDHVPSRQLFHRKHWPEGFEFPACGSCNGATRHEEQVVAMLSRLFPNGETEDQVAETTGIIRAVARNYPNIITEMWPSEDEVKDFLRRRGVTGPAQFPLPEVPLLSVNGPLVVRCIATFVRKLYTALHYKESGFIVPPEGGIGWRWVNNVDPIEDQVPVDFVKLLGGRPIIERAKTNLEDQFNYVCGGPEDGSKAAYYVTFRLSFALFGIVDLDLPVLPDPNQEDRVLRPLSPPD